MLTLLRVPTEHQKVRMHHFSQGISRTEDTWSKIAYTRFQDLILEWCNPITL